MLNPSPFERPCISVTPFGKQDDTIRISCDQQPVLKQWLADLVRITNGFKRGTQMEISERRRNAVMPITQSNLSLSVYTRESS
jgi:hypothetical protein